MRLMDRSGWPGLVAAIHSRLTHGRRNVTKGNHGAIVNNEKNIN